MARYDPHVSEGRSFNIMMFFTMAFLCGMIVHSLNSVYSDTEPEAAAAFEAAIAKDVAPAGCEGTVGPVLGNDFWGTPLVTDTRTADDCTPYLTIQATVVDRGYDYTGTCEGVSRDDGGSGDEVCDAGTVVNDQCRAVLHADFPSVSSSRRLSNASEVRQLRSGHGDDGVCQNVYVPWVKVTFPDPEVPTTTLTRCSYRMGTKGNSATSDWTVVVGQPAVSQAVGVWNVPGTGHPHCVVGTADRPTLRAFVQTSGKHMSDIVPLISLFTFLTVCMCAMCLKTLFITQDEPEKDGEGGDKGKGDDDGGSE